MRKLAGIGFFLGALLVAIGSLLVPRADDLGNVLEMQQAFGDNVVLLQASALLITFGFWAVMAGMIGFYRFTIDSNSPWMLLAFYFHIAGVVLWSMGMSLDISYPAAIANWLAAPAADKDLAYSVVTVLSPLGFGRGLFPLNVLINWLAFTFLGMGIMQNALFPRWLGLVGMVVGLFGLLLGTAMTFTGREALVNLFVILMLLTIVWWLTIAIWLAQKV
jgi:hypothetical protein